MDDLASGLIKAHHDLCLITNELDELEALAEEVIKELVVTELVEMTSPATTARQDAFVHAIDCDLDEDCMCPAGAS